MHPKNYFWDFKNRVLPLSAKAMKDRTVKNVFKYNPSAS